MTGTESVKFLKSGSTSGVGGVGVNIVFGGFAGSLFISFVFSLYQTLYHV